jgi:hypothetical protein
MVRLGGRAWTSAHQGVSRLLSGNPERAGAGRLDVLGRVLALGLVADHRAGRIEDAVEVHARRDQRRR